jgi:hypothetical protein
MSWVRGGVKVFPWPLFLISYSLADRAAGQEPRFEVCFVPSGEWGASYIGNAAPGLLRSLGALICTGFLQLVVTALPHTARIWLLQLVNALATCALWRSALGSLSCALSVSVTTSNFLHTTN